MPFILMNFSPFPITRLCSLFVHNQNQAWRILNQTDNIKVKEKQKTKYQRKKSYNNSSFSTETKMYSVGKDKGNIFITTNKTDDNLI